MVDYSSDTNLIKGAGKAYKNWDNVPGMYAGLDKVAEAGMQLTKAAIAERDKREAEAKATAKARKNEVDEAWNKATETLRSQSANLGRDDYMHSHGVSEKGKAKLVESHALPEGDPKKAELEFQAYQILQNEKALVKDMDDFYNEIRGYEDPELGFVQAEESAAMGHNGQVDGNNGEEKMIWTKFITKDREIEADENTGERIYVFEIEGDEVINPKWIRHMKENDLKPEDITPAMKKIQIETMGPEFVTEIKEVRKTWEQMKAMWIPKVSNKIYTDYNGVLRNWTEKPRQLNIKKVKHDIENVLPKTSDVNSWRALMADEFGFDETFYNMLVNDGSVEDEVNNTLFTFETPDVVENGEVIKKGEDIKVEKDEVIDSYIMKNTEMKNIADIGGGKNGKPDGLVSPEELANFRLAIVDPHHSFWKKTDSEDPDYHKWIGFANKIVIEKLANGVANGHEKNPKNSAYYLP